MNRMGWSVTPDGELPQGAREFLPASGEPIMVPAGIDPGFSYNPGTAHLRAVAAKAANSIELAVGAGLDVAAQQTLREIVDDAAFAQFIALPNPSFPVMILPPALSERLGAKARVALLSEETVGKQTVKRASLPLAVYRELPDLAANADLVALDGENVLIFVRSGKDSWTVAVVKRTRSGQGLFVTSVRQQNDASIPRLLAGTEVIVDRR